MDRGSIGAGGRRGDAAGQSGALPTVDQDQPADVFARRALFPRSRRDRLCRAQGVRSRRRQREGRRGGDLHQRIRGEGGGPTVTAARRTQTPFNPAHSASLRAFTPVFDGLWTRMNALMLGIRSQKLGPRFRRDERNESFFRYYLANCMTY